MGMKMLAVECPKQGSSKNDDTLTKQESDNNILWYIVDLEVDTLSMIPNMTGFEITEVSGHKAAVGHT